LAATVEEKQTYATTATAAEAQCQQAIGRLDTRPKSISCAPKSARVSIVGWRTFSAQLGDYATVGKSQISLVNADSFWVDAYFEETSLGSTKVGTPTRIKLMGNRQVVEGHVASVARGINAANAQRDSQGLASVNPIFTWVRLAQRIPVRIQIDWIPEGVRLVTGMTATVNVNPAEDSNSQSGVSPFSPARAAFVGPSISGWFFQRVLPVPASSVERSVRRKHHHRLMLPMVPTWGVASEGPSQPTAQVSRNGQ
jgi:multidrug resistance efflux pump